MINEFIAKKLGEVLAFAEVGIETLERGQEGFASVLGKSAPEKMLETNKEHSALLKKIAADDKQFGSVTLAKSIKTGEKLRKMRDLYVGDEWDNGVELLEWSGFFEGAALVHWQLVLGAAQGIKNKDLEKLAREASLFHEAFLKTAGDFLHKTGEKRSETM